MDFVYSQEYGEQIFRKSFLKKIVWEMACSGEWSYWKLFSIFFFYFDYLDECS